MSDAPSIAVIDLYIAAYADPDSARDDWNTIKQLAHDDVIRVDALLLVSRGYDGKIEIDDNLHEARRIATLGAVGGAVVGLIFPPALLGSAVVGAGLGAGVGGIRQRGHRKEIREEIEEVLPLNSSGIVAIFEETWVDEVNKALAKASKVTKEKVDKDSVEEVKAEVVEETTA